MIDTIRKKTIYDLPVYQKIILVILAFILSIVIFYLLPAQPSDWSYIFYPVSQIPLHPYSIKTFNYPPWTALMLFPLHYFSENTGRVINASLNLIVIGLFVVKRKGNVVSLVLTLTSFPFLALIANNQIEWIPVLGFILQNGWGLPMLLAKPQSGILAVLSWVLSVKNKSLFFLPAILTIFISFIAWGNWLLDMMANVQYLNTRGLFTISISPFPWAIPLGIGLIFYILKFKPNNSEILGVLATLCMVPYFASQSLIIFFALLSISYPRLAILTWFLLWLFFIL